MKVEVIFAITTERVCINNIDALPKNNIIKKKIITKVANAPSFKSFDCVEKNTKKPLAHS